MKQYFNRAFLHISLFAFLVISAELVHAQTSADPVDSKASARYLDMDQSMLLFDLSYDNPTGHRFHVTVSDEAGNPLYDETCFDRHFYKKFALPAGSADKLSFVVKSSTGSYWKKSFRVHTDIRQEAIVTSL
jgi:hypothetical protein